MNDKKEWNPEEFKKQFLWVSLILSETEKYFLDFPHLDNPIVLKRTRNLFTCILLILEQSFRECGLNQKKTNNSSLFHFCHLDCLSQYKDNPFISDYLNALPSYHFLQDKQNEETHDHNGYCWLILQGLFQDELFEMNIKNNLYAYYEKQKFEKLFLRHEVQIEKEKGRL